MEGQKWKWKTVEDTLHAKSIQYFYRIYSISVTAPYSTVPHYTVCDRILKKYFTLFVTFAVTFYPVTWNVTVNVTFLATENITLHLPLPSLSLSLSKKYRVTSIVTFLVTRDRDRYFYRQICRYR